MTESITDIPQLHPTAMNGNRCLSTLLMAIDCLIPKEHTIREFKSIQSTLMYTAPEMMPDKFHEVARILNRNLPRVDKHSPAWVKSVYAVWLDRSITDINELFSGQ